MVGFLKTRPDLVVGAVAGGATCGKAGDVPVGGGLGASDVVVSCGFGPALAGVVVVVDGVRSAVCGVVLARLIVPDVVVLGGLPRLGQAAVGVSAVMAAGWQFSQWCLSTKSCPLACLPVIMMYTWVAAVAVEGQ